MFICIVIRNEKAFYSIQWTVIKSCELTRQNWQVASMILDGRELEFYKYEGDYKPLLEDVRDKLNDVALNWSREQKDHCLGETEQSFKVGNWSLHLSVQTNGNYSNCLIVVIWEVEVNSRWHSVFKFFLLPIPTRGTFSCSILEVYYSL